MSEYDDLIAAGRRHLCDWRFEEALGAFDAALRLRPEAAAAHYLRGEALFLLRRLDEALAGHAAATRHGIARDGTLGAAMSGMVPGDFAWMSHMLRGEFEIAWRLADAERERRRAAGIDCSGWPRHLRPVWDGSPLSGRNVLVRCYHGLGDTIEFIRYVPLLAEHTASVCIEIQPELIELVQGLPGTARLLPLSPSQDRRAAELGCDAEIDITELPYAFRATLGTVPAPPSLRLDPARTAAARRRLATVPGRCRIGLVWASGDWKRERSIPLTSLIPLAALPGVTLVNLQRGPELERCRIEGAGPPMIHGVSSDDVVETAAMLRALDLVVTVDTMVAHLAGTLAVPVWTMLHFAADWRWLLDRRDSPWYPTMRLFRQPSPGNWDSVVAEIKAALASLPRERVTRPAAARASGRAHGLAAPPRQ